MSFPRIILCVLRLACSLALAVLGLAPLHAQVTTPAPAPHTPRSRPLHTEASVFVNKLDGGYGTWDGLAVRFLYTTRRATPILDASHQIRPNGWQQGFGVGSYITLTRSIYSIVGVSWGGAGTATLYPPLRLDASLLANVPRVPGLVATTGVTDIRYHDPGGGQIWSLGTLYYHGPLILTDVARFNRDRVSGEWSSSWFAGGQYGGMGRYWLGASVSGGTEAYQLLGTTPFDVRFRNVGASAFAQKWVRTASGVLVRYEYEHKLTAYHRHGMTVGLFADW